MVLLCQLSDSSKRACSATQVTGCIGGGAMSRIWARLDCMCHRNFSIRDAVSWTVTPRRRSWVPSITVKTSGEVRTVSSAACWYWRKFLGISPSFYPAFSMANSVFSGQNINPSAFLWVSIPEKSSAGHSCRYWNLQNTKLPWHSCGAGQFCFAA